MTRTFKKIGQFIFILSLTFGWIFSGWPQIYNFPPYINTLEADTTTLTTTSCFLNDASNATCQTALSADGGSTFDVGKTDHADLSLATLASVDTVNSATFYYDHGPSVVSGNWQIFITDTRDGSTICSANPAVENSSEITSSFTCNSITPSQLGTGVWIRVVGETDKSPEDVTLDYLRLDVDYDPVSNASPTLNVDEPDGTDDTVDVGDSYNIQYDLADSDDTVTVAFYYDSDNSGEDGTAISGACATAAEGTDVTCSWDTTGMTPGSYYIYGITDDGTNPAVSDYSSGQITISFTPVYSVSITTDGVVTYGFIELSTASSTISTSYTQTAENDGNTAERLNIKSSDATGGTTWTLSSSIGSDQFKHEFSTTTGSTWTVMPDSSTYVTADPSLAESGTVDFDFRVTVPSASSDYEEKSITLTVQAVAP